MKSAVTACSRVTMWLALAQALWGCAGGGSAPPAYPTLSYGTYQARFAALDAQWGGSPPLGPALLPQAGDASYSGVMNLRLETAQGEERISGALTLGVSFSSNTLSGSAGGFVALNDRPYAGLLQISHGAIDRSADPATGYSYSALIGGTLAADGQSYALAGDLSGDFIGPAAGAAPLAASGAIAGTAQRPGASGYLFGVFIAAR